MPGGILQMDPLMPLCAGSLGFHEHLQQHAVYTQVSIALPIPQVGFQATASPSGHLAVTVAKQMLPPLYSRLIISTGWAVVDFLSRQLPGGIAPWIPVGIRFLQLKSCGVH